MRRQQRLAGISLVLPRWMKSQTGRRYGRSVRLAERLESRQLLSAAITPLASFNGTNGSAPTGAVVVDARGDIFGAAAQGGPNGDGTLFEVPAGTTTITTLVAFSGTNGQGPQGVTMDASGNLFGATSDGKIFELPAGSSTITVLASNAPSGAGDLTLDSRGDLFGAGSSNGGGGSVFEVVAGSGTVRTLGTIDASFFSPSNNVAVDASGNVFGATGLGGPTDDGTVFEIPSAGSLTTVASFHGATTGTQPSGDLAIDSNGNLFGITAFGGHTGQGTIWELPAGSGTIQLVANISNLVNQNKGGVTVDSHGDVFASTASILELPAGSSTVKTLGTFSSSAESLTANPVAVDAAGNVFGTTSGGGDNNDGVIYEISNSGGGGGSGSSLSATVSGRTPSTALVAGQKITPIIQTVRVTNTGSGIYRGPATIDLELSPDSTGATAGETVASTTRQLVLRPNQSAVVPMVVRSLPSDQTGSLFLVAQVTDSSGNSSFGASANALNVQPPMLDLSGMFLHTPSTVRGHNVLATIAVTENGNVPVTGSLTTELFASPDGQLDANSIDLGPITRHVSILPGRRMVLALSAKLPSTFAAGSYTLIATLDPNNTFDDVNLSNNTFLSLSTVTVF